MAVIHIVLIGTSVWRNLNSALMGRGFPHIRQHLESKGLATNKVKETAKVCAEATPGSDKDAECGRRASGSSPAAIAAKEALLLDPRSMSAELNAMYPWLEMCQKRKKGCPTKVYLIHSETGAGEAVAEILASYLEDKKIDVDVQMIHYLGNPQKLPEGLIELARTLRNISERHTSINECILVNPTGGFKVESGYAILALQARALAAYYIHETFKNVVLLPFKGLMYHPALRAILKKVRCDDLWCSLGSVSEVKCLVDALEPIGAIRISKDTVMLSKHVLEALRIWPFNSTNSL